MGSQPPANVSNYMIMNHAISCHYNKLINTYGIWNRDPFKYTTPVLLMQVILIFVITRTLYVLLQPLHQTTIMVQIISGIIIGPSILGETTFLDKLFPLGNRYVLRTWSEFGLVLHMFVLGVQIDMRLLRHIRRRALIIGVSTSLLPLVFGMTSYHIVKETTHLDVDLALGMPPAVVINSMSSLVVIVGVLKELKMLSSELGRLASSAAMVSDLFSIMANILVISITDSQKKSNLKPLYVFPTIISYYSIMFFLLRPLTLWIVRQTSDGESMKQTHFITIICLVLGLSFVGNCVCQDAVMGAFFFGLSLPDGPPLGSQLVQKVEFLNSGFLIPIFCAISGIKMELYLLNDSTTIKMTIIIVMCYLGKFIGVILPSLFFGLSFLKALCLALILSCKGIAELSIYCRWKDTKVITAQIFALVITSMVIMTGIATAIVGYLYDPSRRYRLDARRAILKSKQNNLRILVCINDDDNVNPIISLLEVSNPTRNSPITAFVLQLIELRGSVTAFLKPHHQPSNSIVTSSTHIINALNQFQRCYHGNVVVQHFTTIAPYASMHDDICTLALDKRAAIIIVPFHKQWGVNGLMETSNLQVRVLNKNVIEKAPCSVGILVYRGEMVSNQSLLSGKSLYQVVMLFVGGTDDREALAYCRRMAEHPNIRLTLVYFKTGDVNISHKEIDDLDKQLICDTLKDSMMGKKIIYKEEFVKDGIGTTQVIQSLIDKTVDLFIVGKNHDLNSSVTLGLSEWMEYPELGIIGDTLVNSNDTFSILVVQQQQDN
ncbi:Cation/H(+) antiporter like [Melia azedarach]|uniref:Cation/H(+) antiporter like n=1 Tax=Melia azedarach TaxID=155640 RepID=A0ACC1Y608_MELAZ|nr:Cation/H(+) antiporter like [Melia azedarach]